HSGVPAKRLAVCWSAAGVGGTMRVFAYAPGVPGSKVDYSMQAAVYLQRGTRPYRRANLALFCAGFATFALLYCVQPLLPTLAQHFSLTAATSALALSLTTLSLAFCLLLSGALSESLGRKPVMVAALGLACALGIGWAQVELWDRV